MLTWKDRIRALRDSGMSLAEIGKESGLATSTVSDLARGVTKEPGGNAALKIDALYREKRRPSSRPGSVR